MDDDFNNIPISKILIGYGISLTIVLSVAGLIYVAMKFFGSM